MSPRWSRQYPNGIEVASLFDPVPESGTILELPPLRAPEGEDRSAEFRAFGEYLDGNGPLPMPRYRSGDPNGQFLRDARVSAFVAPQAEAKNEENNRPDSPSRCSSFYEDEDEYEYHRRSSPVFEDDDDDEPTGVDPKAIMPRPPPPPSYDDALPCPYPDCPFSTSTAPDLAAHIQSHKKKKWVCCGVRADSPAALSFRGGDARPRMFNGRLMVGGCWKGFQRRWELQRHVAGKRAGCVGEGNTAWTLPEGGSRGGAGSRSSL